MQKEEAAAAPARIVFERNDKELIEFLEDKLKGKELEPQVQLPMQNYFYVFDRPKKTNNKASSASSSCCFLEENRPRRRPQIICDVDAPRMLEFTADYNNDQNSVSLYCDHYIDDDDDAYSGLTPISDINLSQDNNGMHKFYLHQEASSSRCSCSSLAFDILNPSTFNILQQGVAMSVCPSGLMPTPEVLMAHMPSWEFVADDQRTKASFIESLRMEEKEMEQRLEKLLQEHTCQYN